MTISDIKRKTLKKSPYYFDRKTLKHFGQTQSSFKIVTSKTGKVFIYAPMRDSRGVKGGFSISEFKDNDLVSVYAVPFSVNTSAKIKSYLSKK